MRDLLPSLLQLYVNNTVVYSLLLLGKNGSEGLKPEGVSKGQNVDFSPLCKQNPQ